MKSSTFVMFNRSLEIIPQNIHIERRFHALIFDLLNLANPKFREDKATKASTWYDYIDLYLLMNNW